MSGGNLDFKDASPQILKVSRFPSLNNDGDSIVLLDRNGAVVDSMAYTKAPAGFSLERISASTKVTQAAPRDNASMPTEPVPAYKSRNTHPGTRGASISKSDFFIRARIGRVITPFDGPFINIFRYFPPMIRSILQL